jgi:uncharacterized protein YraI
VDYNYPGGPVEIRVEYFENTQNASISVHLGLIPDGGAAAPVQQPAQAATSTSSSCTTPTGFNAAVNASLLNFREGPATSFAIIETLPLCATVQLTSYKAAPPSTWVQVRLPDGQTAWANSSYMVMGASIDQMSVLTD